MEFNELLELFTKEKFQEVVENASKCNDVNALFLKCRSLVALNKIGDAMNLLYEKRNVMLNESVTKFVDLFILVKTYAGVLPFEIINELDFLNDLPYISTEFEEYLKNLNKKIFEIYNECSQNHNFKLNENIINEYDEALKTNNFNAIADVLLNLAPNDPLSSKMLSKSEEYLLNCSDNNPIFGFIFSRLEFSGCDKTFYFKDEDKYYALNPSKCQGIYNKHYHILAYVFGEIDETIKDVSLDKNLKFLMSISTFVIFPKLFKNFREAHIYLNACLKILKVNLNFDDSVDAYLRKIESSKKLENFYFSRIDNYLKNFQ